MAGLMSKTFNFIAAMTFAMGAHAAYAADQPNFRSPKGVNVPDTEIGTCVKTGLSAVIPNASDHRAYYTASGDTRYAVGDRINESEDGVWIEATVSKDGSTLTLENYDMGVPGDERTSAKTHAVLDLKHPENKVPLTSAFKANVTPETKQKLVSQSAMAMKEIRECIMKTGM